MDEKQIREKARFKSPTELLEQSRQERVRQDKVKYRR